MAIDLIKHQLAMFEEVETASGSRYLRKKFMYTLRPYQLDAKQSIFSYFEQGGLGNPIVAMPTATGKSLVIGSFVAEVLCRWPNQRIMMLTHVKELIEQNAKKLLEFWPNAPMGIYSAGLNSRNSIMPITFGGIASVVNALNMFGKRDLIIIDEAHLLSPKDDTMYQQAIAHFKRLNPYLKVIGFTATPYRLGQGLLTDDGIFTDFCYDITGFEAYNKLIEDGYLSMLIPRPTDVELDVSKVHLVNGDFNQGELEAAINQDAITFDACKEIVAAGQDRCQWLIFAAGIKHSDNIALMMQSLGVDCASVHSKHPTQQNDANIKAFRAGQIRCIVNYGKLTTGFDHPPIDLIADLRPTMSPGLHVQKLGRGGRPSPETLKANCLVLDFARNILRLGPVNDPIIPRKKTKGQPGTPPVKICPNCGVYNHTRVTFCIGCGYEFPKILDITPTAGTHEVIRLHEERQEQWFKVDRVIYNRHQKNGPPMIRVDYCSGLNKPIPEFICLEHGGYARKKAAQWWMQRGGGMAPQTTDEALMKIKDLSEPKKIRVWTNTKYPTILGYEF